jgi:hypothetical protein
METVTTAELIWPELLVPETVQVAVDALTPEQLAITLVKPLDWRYFTSPDWTWASTLAVVALYFPELGGPMVPIRPV